MPGTNYSHMQPDIFEFLKKLDEEVMASGQLSGRVEAEVTMYKSILETLVAVKTDGANQAAVAPIEKYLTDLQLVGLKLKHSHLVLLNQTHTETEATLNKQLLGLLKKLNSL